MEGARGETKGLRDARDEARENQLPLLKAQALDDYFIKKGAEYIAYEALTKVSEQLERSQEGFRAAQEERDHADEELAAAQYDLDLVRNVENYDRVKAAKARFEAAQ